MPLRRAGHDSPLDCGPRPREYAGEYCQSPYLEIVTVLLGCAMSSRIIVRSHCGCNMPRFTMEGDFRSKVMWERWEMANAQLCAGLRMKIVSALERSFSCKLLGLKFVFGCCSNRIIPKTQAERRI